MPVFNSPQEIFIPWLCPISPQTHIAFFVLQCPDGKEYHSLNYMLPKKYFLLLGLNLPSPLFTWCVSVYLKLPLHRKSNRTTPLSLALQAWQVKAGRYANEMERMGVNGGTIRWGGYQTAVKKSICEPQCSCHPDNNRLQAHALLCLTHSCNRALKPAEPSHSCRAGISVYSWLAQPRRSGGWETLSGLYRSTPSRMLVSPPQLHCVHLFAQEQYNRGEANLRHKPGVNFSTAAWPHVWTYARNLSSCECNATVELK